MPETIAHYTILEKLGSGGMGAVFRAHDTRLGRDVALKLLPAELFADPDARARLVREARLASALNHPNVCTIHEVGEADGQTYLAMELVRGRPLREIIPRGGMPLQSLLHYGAQIADALEHAHAQGVVHRDLKASNVVITEDGRAKVLDFGLARRAGVAGDANLAEAQTLTQSGAIAGTPPYLSPEVLRGSTADARSDIWSLGILLYEMASGGLPFRGRTGPELSAAILKDPAPPLPARVPPGLRGVIGRCLEKEPARRFRNAGEVRAALEALQSDLRVPVLEKGTGRGNWAPRVAVLLVVPLLVGIGAWLALMEPWRTRELKQRQLTSNLAENPIYVGALSPDGKTLAYVDQTGLFLRTVDSGETRPVALTPELVLKGQLFPVVDWFPDGSQLLLSALNRDGKSTEWVIPVLGGRPRILIDNAGAATVSRDGRHLAFLRRRGQGDDIWLSGPNGENQRRLVAADSSAMVTTWVAWSPNGRRLAYVRGKIGPQGDEMWIETCDLAGRTRRAFMSSRGQLLHAYSIPCWLADDRLAFSLTDPPPNQSDMNLWSLQVDSRTGAPSGIPRRVTQWQRLSLLVPSPPSRDHKRLAIGTLLYQSDCYIGRVAGGDSTLQGVRRLTLDSRFDWEPSWLPDNSAIVFASDRNGSEDIFRQALNEQEAQPIVTGPGDQNVPSVSPDGAWTLYIDHPASASSTNPSTASLMRAPLAGGPSIKVFDVQGNASYACAPPPASVCVLSEIERGQTVFTEFDPVRGRGRTLVRVPGGRPRPWGLSPDGTTLAIVDPLDSIPRIETVSLHGGATREVKLDREISIVHVSWAAKGQGWLVVGIERGGWQLLSVDAKGKARALIPPQQWMYSAAPSPDGRWIAFTSNTTEGNIWLLEDF